MVDVEKVSAILIECAQAYILPRYKMLGDHEINTKSGPNDLVTQADLDVEAHLIRTLPDILPGSVVIGEESASADESKLDILQDKGQSAWIVDPVDGTHNFVHHRRHFGIMLACVIDGETKTGWIYDVLGETMSVAEKGSGAFANGRALKVSSERGDEAVLTGHINPRFFPKKYQNFLYETRKSFKECHSLYCAAHEYLRIAEGRAHFSVYSKLKPWDHLAGALLVEEAGGYVAKWDGSPYTAQDHHAGLIIANNQDCWETVFRKFIKDHF